MATSNFCSTELCTLGTVRLSSTAKKDKNERLAQAQTQNASPKEKTWAKAFH